MKYLEVLITALRLGLTSFGGPIAHLSYFHNEYVKKREWLNEKTYVEIVALCQFLPGPASSQVGMAIGFSRAGIFGAFLSWLGFTLPSALILTLLGLGLVKLDLSLYHPLLHGLKIVTVAIVAQAVLSMGKRFCRSIIGIIIAIIGAIMVNLSATPLMQIAVLFLMGIVGATLCKVETPLSNQVFSKLSHRYSAIFLILFFTILLLLPLIRSLYPSHSLQLFESFYRVGSLVFGGGHVVLPLLQTEVVTNGWVTNDLFMMGYGLANAIPGPLFTLSAYLGAVSGGWWDALICLVAIFLPSFLLILGILPFWEKLKTLPKISEAMVGINAAVVGILLAALYNPVYKSAIFSYKDFLLALGSFVLLELVKLPSWLVVIISVTVSFLGS